MSWIWKHWKDKVAQELWRLQKPCCSLGKPKVLLHMQILKEKKISLLRIAIIEYYTVSYKTYQNPKLHLII